MQDLQARIESAIASVAGGPVHIMNSQACGGGSINDCRLLQLQDGRQFFLKTHANASNLKNMFALEFEALQLLASAKSIRVPEALACDDDFILMEAFSASTKPADWAEKMGHELALLHLAMRKKRYGFDKDNYLGSTPQPNRWCDSWLEFWRDNRLADQLQRFSRKTSRDDPLLQCGEQLLQRLDEILGEVKEEAVLLHGDLWSGNAAADESGQPIIFDPASYYGHHEAEIGMMRMFGGFGPRCEAAYAEIWPFEPESERRITLYRLHHELNHLNLFGAGYYQGCLDTIRSLI